MLTIIPAKGGSTRLKKKNIAILGGKALIAYPIENAIESGVCGRVCVSTENKEIARIACKYGAEVPFLRPYRLARDPARVVDVCLHALDVLDPQENWYDILIVLLPTAPLCKANDIIQALDTFEKKDGHLLMSVTECVKPPFNALRYDGNGEYLVSCFPDSEYSYAKSTECPRTFHSNGAITIVDVDYFRKEKTFFGEGLLAYEMPNERSVDIDTSLDLDFARYLMANQRGKM